MPLTVIQIKTIGSKYIYIMYYKVHLFH